MFKRVLPQVDMPRSRLDGLTDGVMAIALTLLVLDFRMPELTGAPSNNEFIDGLAALAPTLFAFLLSFLVLGMGWYQHHQQSHWFKRIDTGLLILNLTNLATVSLFPFIAMVLARFTMVPWAVVIYAFASSLLVTNLTIQWLWAWRFNLLDPHLAAAKISSHFIRQIVISSLIWAVCAVTFIRAWRHG